VLQENLRKEQVGGVKLLIYGSMLIRPRPM
jgi:hypothetical protein